MTAERPRGIQTPAGRLILPATATLTDAWFEARRTRVGGSEVAALLGLSPWASWFSLWHSKKGYWSQAELDEMRWGRLLEAPIAAWFGQQHPEYHVAKVGTYTHNDRDWQLCTPDALLCAPASGRSRNGGKARGGRYAHAGLEVKCDRYDDGWGEPGTDEIPVYYRCQVLWQMDVTGLDEWWVAVLFGGSDYREYRVVMDDAARADLKVLYDAAEAFLADLANDRRPDIDAHTVTHQVIRDIHPDIDRDINVTVDDQLADDYWHARDVYKDAEDNHRYYSSLLLDEIGGGRGAYTTDGRKVAYRHPSNHGAPPHLRDWRPRKKPTQIQPEEGETAA